MLAMSRPTPWRRRQRPQRRISPRSLGRIDRSCNPRGTDYLPRGSCLARPRLVPPSRGRRLIAGKHHGVARVRERACEGCSTRRGAGPSPRKRSRGGGWWCWVSVLVTAGCDAVGRSVNRGAVALTCDRPLLRPHVGIELRDSRGVDPAPATAWTFDIHRQTGARFSCSEPRTQNNTPRAADGGECRCVSVRPRKEREHRRHAGRHRPEGASQGRGDEDAQRRPGGESGNPPLVGRGPAAEGRPPPASRARMRTEQWPAEDSSIVTPGPPPAALIGQCCRCVTHGAAVSS